jgi:hypothetical protein
MNKNTKQIIIWSTVLIGCIIVGIYSLNRPVPTAPGLPVNPIVDGDPQTNFQLRKDFYHSSVNPQIATADRANRKAAERCLQRIESRVDGYRDGIKPFVSDINTWGSRLTVIRRLGSDWWYEQNDVAAFVGGKVKKHLFDDERIKSDINEAIQQFRYDVHANEQTMLLKIRAAVAADSNLDLSDNQFDDFAVLVHQNMLAFANTLAHDSVLKGLVRELVSAGAGAAATQLIYLIGTHIATMTASSAAGAGGATAATTGGGAVAGTTIGPWGTAAGFVGGLVVGLVIDWWRSKAYEAELTGQLNEAIDNIKLGARDGVNGQNGLKITLDKACDQLLRTYEETLYHQVVGGNTE